MKKILALVLCLCTLLTLFVACGDKEVDYKLGMGIDVSTASSKKGTAQVDATVATVVLDADGKIVACRIDVAQNKMNVAEGAVETAKTFETKMELGTKYGMAGNQYSSDNNGDGVIKEWNEQAKLFEEYVVGKTAAEIEALQTQEVNKHFISKDEELLKAGCTIDITAFQKAIVKACKDEQAVAFKATEGSFTLGVAAKTTIDAATVAATAEKDGVVAMYSDFAASVVVEGKIVASLNDAIQPKIAITAAGEIGATTFKDTKRVLKAEYGMAGNQYSSDNNGDGVIKEWFEQSAEFSKYVVGKTADEVANMATQTLEGHEVAKDDALLKAGCTIQITSIKAVVAQSAKNAR